MGWSKSKPYSEMTLDERVNALIASQQMMSDENMTYRQQELPPEARFSGEFGLPSYLGYLGGKDRGQARIKTVGINEPYTFGSIGSYYRADPEKTDTDKREEIILGRVPLSDQEDYKRYYKGIPEPDMIYVDYPADAPQFDQSKHPEETLQTMRELAGVSQKIRDARTATTAGVLSHELEHRFYDLPFYKDMVRFYGYPQNIPHDEMYEAGLFDNESRKDRIQRNLFTSSKDPYEKYPENKQFFLEKFYGLPMLAGFDSQHRMAINPIDRRFRPSLRAGNIKDYLNAAKKINVNRRAIRFNEQYGDEDKAEELRKEIKKQQELFQGKFSDDDKNIQLARRRDFLIRNYLTPERQEQYGLRLPARGTISKEYEQLLEKQEESGVMDKIFALIGKLSS
tara:strand:+ start:715 stop:1902 length:1188 start_codon:yes stop_codon:yes gene_type:complete